MVIACRTRYRQGGTTSGSISKHKLTSEIGAVSSHETVLPRRVGRQAGGELILAPDVQLRHPRAWSGDREQRESEPMCGIFAPPVPLPVAGTSPAMTAQQRFYQKL